MSCTRGGRGEGVVWYSPQLQIRSRSRVLFFLRKLRSRNARPRCRTEYVPDMNEDNLPISPISRTAYPTIQVGSPLNHAVLNLSNLSHSHGTVRTPYLPVARLAARQQQPRVGGSSERFSETSSNGDGQDPQEARPAPTTKAAQPSPQPPLTHHTRSLVDTVSLHRS